MCLLTTADDGCTIEPQVPMSHAEKPILRSRILLKFCHPARYTWASLGRTSTYSECQVRVPCSRRIRLLHMLRYILVQFMITRTSMRGCETCCLSLGIEDAEEAFFWKRKNVSDGYFLSFCEYRKSQPSNGQGP
jgi:hypothetical protein